MRTFGKNSLPPAAAQGRPALSLLVVEDDSSAVEVLSRMISRKFPEVTIYTAGDGKTGIELCKKYASGIVVTDINMPGMDGVQMIEEIRSIKADTKFIVLTGYSDKAHLDKFNEIGVNYYIMKPVEFTKLFATIEKNIDEIYLNK